MKSRSYILVTFPSYFGRNRSKTEISTRKVKLLSIFFTRPYCEQNTTKQHYSSTFHYYMYIENVTGSIYDLRPHNDHRL